MSNEELERIMNFIVERQEYASEQIVRLTEAEARLAELLKDHEERIARFERSYIRIAQLLEKHDDQLEAVTKGLNDLTTLVTRYIAARGDGSNGGA